MFSISTSSKLMTHNMLHFFSFFQNVFFASLNLFVSVHLLVTPSFLKTAAYVQHLFRPLLLVYYTTL